MSSKLLQLMFVAVVATSDPIVAVPSIIEFVLLEVVAAASSTCCIDVVVVVVVVFVFVAVDAPSIKNWIIGGGSNNRLCMITK